MWPRFALLTTIPQSYLLALESQPVLLHRNVDAADCDRAGDTQMQPILVHQVKKQQPVDLQNTCTPTPDRPGRQLVVC